MTLLALEVPADTTLPLYDLPEATYSKGYTVERNYQLISESLFEKASFRSVKSQSKKDVLSSF